MKSSRKTDMIYSLLCLILVFVVSGIDGQAHISHIDVPAKIGSRLELSCAFSSTVRGKITWRSNGELIAIGSLLLTSNPRINLIRTATIEINPIRESDFQTYTCSADDDVSSEQRFRVHSESDDYHRPIEQPDPYVPQPPRYPSGHPECHNLDGKINQLSHGMEDFHQRLHIIETILGRLEYHIKTLPHPPPPPPPPPTKSFPSNQGETPIATQIQLEGKLLYEYTWEIRNFIDELFHAICCSDGKSMLKTNFLTNIPGYNMTTLVYPNRDNSGYIGIYVRIAKGSYDHLLAWPFRNRIELSFVSYSSYVKEKVAVITPFQTGCESNVVKVVHCGYFKYMSIDEFNQESFAFMRDGNLSVRIRVYA